MTQDEIIAMAREAGFKMENSAAMQAAKAFYKLVAAKEREEERECPRCKDYKAMYIKVRDELAAEQQRREA